MKKILCLLLVVALLAAVMCVPAFATCVESKGDGFSLFNGVKLPSLPEYDKEKYPYAFIYYQEDQYSLVLVGCVVHFGNFIEEDKLTWLPEFSVSIQIWNIDHNVWEIKVDSVTSAGYLVDNPYEILLWANWDTAFWDYEYNETNGLTASEPISLDGMNVIEWDGDTEGLEVFTDSISHYLVSSATDVDLEKGGIFCTTRNSTVTATVGNNWNNVDGHFYRLNIMNYISEASDVYPTAGIFFIKNTLFYSSLLAYYPIEAGTAVPENILFLDSIGATLNTVVSMLGSVAQTIATNPLLFVCFAVGFIGIGAALFKRIRK